MKSAGFTLLEMLVVLGIIGLIAGLGFPSLERALAATEFHAAATRLELTVQQRRADALRLGQPERITLDELTAAARGVDPRRVDAALRITGPTQGLRFFADGSTSGGEIGLARGTRSLRFGVDRELGTLRPL